MYLIRGLKFASHEPREQLPKGACGMMPSSGKNGLENGAECIANYDFKGSNPKDLPFKKGDILIIIGATKDPNWYTAKRASDGKSGTIPVNYIQKRGAMNLHAMPWFFGKISRDHAEELLQPREPGLFLVRESTNYPGDYTLCVCSPAFPETPKSYHSSKHPVQNKVEHYRVITQNGKLTVDEEEYFETLLQLVDHYQKDADGLCHKLTKALTKKVDMDISSSAFIESFKKEGWVVNFNELKLMENVGSGEFGEVYQGEYGARVVAVKKLKDDSKAVQAFLSEASVMTTLKHKNLVELIGICFQSNEVYIVTEFCEKRSLVDYLRSRGRSVITPEDQRSFSIDVARGMCYLEERNIVHRDLAARNVLLAKDMTAKVADFGLAKNLSQELEKGKFPVKWTAPEAIKDNNFSTKSDVWSFGIFLWEVYSFGRNPYPRVPLKDVLSKVEHGYRMEIPEGCPHNIYKMMQRCWNIDPSQRPSFSSLKAELEHTSRETPI